MISRISRATDSIWRTADLEFGDPHENEEEWFRDKQNMYNTYGSNTRNDELMTLVPGWDEAKSKGWKSLGPGVSPIAYRGSGDSFEFIAPKHLDPDGPHWQNIPDRWIRYSQGEGGVSNPYVMHAKTFQDAIQDRNLAGWNLYNNSYDPESGEFTQTYNNRYPYSRIGPEAHTDAFKPGKTGPGHFEWMRQQAEAKDKRLRGEP